MSVRQDELWTFWKCLECREQALTVAMVYLRISPLLTDAVPALKLLGR